MGGPRVSDRIGLAKLSPRELQVIKQYALGFRLPEISAALGLDRRSVYTCYRRACDKMEWETRHAMVTHCWRNGVVS